MIRRVVVCLLLASCGRPATRTATNAPISAQEPGPADASPSSEPEPVRVGLSLHVTPRDAQVTVDDQPRGKAADLLTPIALAPGLHTLVVSRAGYKTYRAEFSVTDKIETFVVALDPAR